MWGHASGTDPKLKEDEQISSWNMNDTKIKTWILGTVEPYLILNLKPYKTMKAM